MKKSVGLNPAKATNMSFEITPGAVAHERGITTDTKDNGCVESMFWAAMDIAGFTEEDL